MSGHSKWANIKHKKNAMDVKRGVIFTKLAREIAVASRQGSSGDPINNHRLRLAIEKAKQANIPQDNIARAINKGLGTSTDGNALEEAIYEGYGPGGAAILVQTVTDNRNRTSAEVRTVFTRAGGSLGGAGSVAWLFENKALITIDRMDDTKIEELTLAIIDAGAEDVEFSGELLETWGPPSTLDSLCRTIETLGFKPSTSTITMLPQTTAQLDESAQIQTIKLLEKLDDLDDVNQVYTNAEFSDAILEKYQSS